MKNRFMATAFGLAVLFSVSTHVFATNPWQSYSKVFNGPGQAFDCMPDINLSFEAASANGTVHEYDITLDSYALYDELPANPFNISVNGTSLVQTGAVHSSEGYIDCFCCEGNVYCYKVTINTQTKVITFDVTLQPDLHCEGTTPDL